MKQKIYLITGLMASGKSTVSDLLAKSIEKCVHLRGDVFRKMIISGRENMSATPSAEAVRQLYLRYKLTADAARSYFDNGFSVVIQDNYYGDELNRMINYLHKSPASSRPDSGWYMAKPFLRWLFLEFYFFIMNRCITRKPRRLLPPPVLFPTRPAF